MLLSSFSLIMTCYYNCISCGIGWLILCLSTFCQLHESQSCEWYGRKRSGPILKYYYSICLKWLRKTRETLIQESRSLCRGWNPGYRKHDAGVSVTPARRSWFHTSCEDVRTNGSSQVARMTDRSTSLADRQFHTRASRATLPARSMMWNFVEQSAPWGANGLSPSSEILHLLWNYVHCRVHKSLPRGRALSQTNAVNPPHNQCVRWKWRF